MEIKESMTAKVRAVIEGMRKDASFVEAMETLYGSEGELLSENMRSEKRRLSSGTSSIKTLDQYVRIAADSIMQHANYRNYAPPQGSADARRALAIMENIKFEGNFAYGAEDFCLTEGGTGAISSIFELIRKTMPGAEVIIPSPSYYAFKLCARENGIRYKEVKPHIKAGSPAVSIDAIIDAVTPQTKLIVMTHPGNPTGEIHGEEAIRRLLEFAAKRDILVLSDELFSELIFDTTRRFVSFDEVAQKMGLLDHLVTIKAYSKSRNIPGFRIGYSYSANKKIVEGLAKIQEQRSFSASASNFKEIIILDSMYQSVDQTLQRSDDSIEDVIHNLVAQFSENHISLPVEAAELHDGYVSFRQYMDASLEYYRQGLEVVRQEFTQLVRPDESPDPQAAFNTLVHIRCLDGVDMFNFCMNLFLFYGVKVHVGPYFGFTQKVWQDELGFWLRISFSSDAPLLKDAIRRFVLFTEEYLNDPSQFVKLTYKFV